MKIPSKVTIIEVGPRDGFQNEPMIIPTDIKIDIIDKLAQTGLKCIEAAIFGHPKVMPQVADAEEVLQRIKRREGVTYLPEVPNLRGLERALQVNPQEIRLVMCASEAQNKALLNKSVADSLEEVREISRIAIGKGIKVGGSIAGSFGSSIEGWVPPEQVERIALAYIDMGMHEVSLGDTTGMATPEQVRQLVRRLHERINTLRLVLHFHNTRGAGLANVYAGLLEGVTLFESSIGGLGGCPFAPGATGNIATEDLVHMLESMGIDTGVDLTKLLECSKYVQNIIGRDLPSQVLKAGSVPWALKTDLHHPTINQ